MSREIPSLPLVFFHTAGSRKSFFFGIAAMIPQLIKESVLQLATAQKED